jgi:predicted kinase
MESASDLKVFGNKPWLVLCWGAPAAGKSTVSRAWCAQFQAALPRLSSDGVNQALIGESFDPIIRPAIYEGLLTMAEGLLRRSRPVVLDGTFLDYQTRKSVAELAQACEAVFVSVHVYCPLALRIARNAARPISERVPDCWLRQAHARAHHGGRDSHLRLDTSQTPVEEATEQIGVALLGRLRRRYGLVRKPCYGSSMR